ncbi:MAG: hypothetical protein WAT61_10460, partial [Flavobacteriales bacterium]
QGLRIRSKAHVGRVDLGVCSVVIEPKLPLKRFLNLLRFAYGFRKLEMLDATLQGMAEHGLAELLVHQFLQETGEIMQRGLRRQYRRKVEHLGTPRGKLLFGGLARGRGWDTAVLECEHHERNPDNPLNAALLFGLGLVPRITKDIALRSKARRLAMHLKEEVSDRPFNSIQLQRLITRLDRQNKHYTSALQLVQLLLSGTGVVLEGTDVRSVPVPGFLFDMNRFYQAVLGRFLQTFLPVHEVIEEQSIKGMFRYDRIEQERTPRAPQPRPDFVVKQAGEVVGVFDAKYRDLSDRSLPREMLYQLSIYALSGLDPKRSAVILYPSASGTPAERRICITDPINGTGLGEVVLRAVNLEMLEGIVQSDDNRLRDQQGRAMAIVLIYGTGNLASTVTLPKEVYRA